MCRRNIEILYALCGGSSALYKLAGGIEGLANIERLPQGMTVFLTAHNIEDAERMCDRMDFIVGGRIGVNGICRCVVIRLIRRRGSGRAVTQGYVCGG